MRHPPKFVQGFIDRGRRQVRLAKRRSKARTFCTQYMPSTYAIKRFFVLELIELIQFSKLAGAGGIEPPNGGIKIQMIRQRFQCAFRKTSEIRAYIQQ